MRQRARSAVVLAASLLLTGIAAGAIPSWSAPHIPDGASVLQPGLLGRVRGADPSASLRKDQVNCAILNIVTHNDTVADPTKHWVTSVQCNDRDFNSDPPTYPFNNRTCISCPTIGQSILLNNDTVKNGFVGPVGQVTCGVGQKGTCINGSCVNTSLYECSNLKFYQRQSGPGGGSGGGGPGG